MHRAVAALCAACWLASCVSPPPGGQSPERPPSPDGTPPENAQSGPDASTERQPSPPIIPERSDYPALVRSAERTLSSGTVVARQGAEPAFVVTGIDASGSVGIIGLALDADDALLWHGTVSGGDTVKIAGRERIAAAREVRDFAPVAISEDGPWGFSALLVSDASEIRVIGLRVGGDAYIVAVPQSPTRLTEVRDADSDGQAELLQYSSVFEAPSNREIVVDLFEWDRDAFVLSTSTPILRMVNEFLGRVEAALTEPSIELLPSILLSAVVVEGPPLETLLPPDRVNVPRLQEVPVEISRRPWVFPFDFLVASGEREGVYRIELVLPDNPAAGGVQIKG